MSIEYDKSDGRWVTDVTVVTWLVSYLISVLFSQICCDTWVQVGWTITIGNFENVVDLWPNRPGAELSWKGPLSARWLTVRQPQRKSSSVESTSAQVAKTSVTVNDSCSFQIIYTRTFRPHDQLFPPGSNRSPYCWIYGRQNITWTTSTLPEFQKV